MKAELMTIGDELLIGQVVDTNSAFIAQELQKIGVEVVQITSIPDRLTAILDGLSQAQSRADLVITTGGLGPTKDDITKEAFCRYFDTVLVENSAWMAHVKELFAKYISTPINAMNYTQAMLPATAELLANPYGTAAGMWMENQRGVVVAMPGVPFEMKSMVTDQLIPRLTTRFKRPYIAHKTIVTYGLGESAVAELIEDWEASLPEALKLAYLPNLGKVRLRISGTHPDQQVLHQMMEEALKGLYPLIQHLSYSSEHDRPVEALIAEKLTQLGGSLALAESFTGGALAARFTQMPGASAYFKGSAVVYASEAKSSLLEVSTSDLEAYSSVSSQVAESMVLGAQRTFGAQYAISTTGNAGPSVGDSKEEVGVVYLGIATPERVWVERHEMGNHRERIVEKSINKALTLLYAELLKL